MFEIIALPTSFCLDCATIKQFVNVFKKLGQLIFIHIFLNYSLTT